jgi:hypothetical protein
MVSNGVFKKSISETKQKKAPKKETAISSDLEMKLSEYYIRIYVAGFKWCFRGAKVEGLENVVGMIRASN